MIQDVEFARKLLLSRLAEPEDVKITTRAYWEARNDFGLTKDGILGEARKNLKNGINISTTDQESGSTGWVIKPHINGIPAYIKFCIEDENEEVITTIVSAHK